VPGTDVCHGQCGDSGIDKDRFESHGVRAPSDCKGALQDKNKQSNFKEQLAQYNSFPHRGAKMYENLALLSGEIAVSSGVRTH
jgi:hypothetical protein